MQIRGGLAIIQPRRLNSRAEERKRDITDIDLLEGGLGVRKALFSDEPRASTCCSPIAMPYSIMYTRNLPRSA